MPQSTNGRCHDRRVLQAHREVLIHRLSSPRPDDLSDRPQFTRFRVDATCPLYSVLTHDFDERYLMPSEPVEVDD